MDLHNTIDLIMFMFHKMLSSALCLFAIGVAYAQPDKLEQRRGVMSSDVQEDLCSEIPTSKKALKNRKEVVTVLKETKSCLDLVACATDTVSESGSLLKQIKQDSEDEVVSRFAIDASSSNDDVCKKKVFLDDTKSTANDRSARKIFLEESREVSQVSKDDVELSPAIEKKSSEDIALEKEASLKLADSIANRILGPDGFPRSVVDTVHAIPSHPVAPIVIIIQQPSAPILSPPVQRVAPPSRAFTTVRSVTPTVFVPRSYSLARDRSRSMQPTQIVDNTTQFVNILAQRQETATRGAGSFSCTTPLPHYAGISEASFASKGPLFNGMTLSYASSNVPIDSLQTSRR